MPVLSRVEGAWNHMPQHQQRGSQLKSGAPKEAIADRGAQQHDLADLQAEGTTEPQRGIDYPSDNVPCREGDITPTLPADDAVNWDDVVQPENHSRQVEAQDGQGGGAGAADDDEPLPEGK